jgi:ABC-type lipoprotein release transport system permease subunit
VRQLLWFLNLAQAGAAAIFLHRLRSLVIVLALLAVLVPFLIGLGISQGIRDEAEISLRAGADFLVTGSQFSRSVPVPLAAAADIRQIDGVREVVPRIVGTIHLGKDREPTVLVGIPRRQQPAEVSWVKGRLYQDGNNHELVVGSELAERLKLKVDSSIPPFYRNDKGDRVSRVVGILDSGISFWQARLVLCSFETAAYIFDQEGVASDLLVFCKSGYADHVRRAIAELPKAKGAGESAVGWRIVARADAWPALHEHLLHQEGVFNLHGVLAFSIAILTILVAADVGLSGRRREVGILRATGWQTDEVMLRDVIESLLLAVGSASLAVIVACIWLGWFNGWWVAGIFLPDMATTPGQRVPFSLSLGPIALVFVMAIAIVSTGTLYSTWRAASSPPRMVMR